MLGANKLVISQVVFTPMVYGINEANLSHNHAVTK